jgi:predicted metal-binding membrane protein
MMLAMMLPSLHAMLGDYRRALSEVEPARRDALTVVAGAGYFLVWVLLGAILYPVGVAIGAAEMGDASLARLVPYAVAAVWLLAGLLQLTAWKARQLHRCRDLAGGNESMAAGFRHGLHLGVRCSVCCSGLMAVLLAGGVMDLALMAVVTAAVSAERVLPRPVLVARISGVAITAAALLALARAAA